MATTATIRMPARRTAITDRAGLSAACLLAPVPGITDTGAAGITAGAVITVAGDITVGEATLGRGTVIGPDMVTVAVHTDTSEAAIMAGIEVAAFTAAAEVMVDSTAVASMEVDSTAVGIGS